MQLKLSFVLSCLALLVLPGFAAPVAPSMSDDIVLFSRQASASTKALFDQAQTSPEWKRIAENTAIIDSSCDAHKKEIINGLLYARSTAYVAYKAALAGRMDTVFDYLYRPRDRLPILRMLSVVSKLGNDTTNPFVSFKISCPSVDPVKNRFATTSTSKNEIKLSPSIFSDAYLPAASLSNATLKESHKRGLMGYTLLSQLTRLEPVAKAANWPWATYCSTSKRLAGCGYRVPPNPNRVASLGYQNMLLDDLRGSICLNSKWKAKEAPGNTNPKRLRMSPLKNSRAFSTFAFLSAPLELSNTPDRISATLKSTLATCSITGTKTTGTATPKTATAPTAEKTKACDPSKAGKSSWFGKLFGKKKGC